jgi:hypothetical protein
MEMSEGFTEVYKLLRCGDKAIEFLRSDPRNDSRFTVLQGAVRSGKTWAMMAKFLGLCAYDVKGQRLLTGATKETVFRNVLNDLFDLVGTSRYTYNRQSGELSILGTKWVVMGAKDEGSERNVRGMTVGIWYADEVVTYPASFINMALNRMSPTGARAYWTTNTDSPYHHVKEIMDRLVKNGDMRVIEFGLDDNPHLDEDTKAFLRRSYTGVFYQRYILGLWIVAEGAIYGSCWDENALCYDGPCPVGQGVGEETIAVDCGVAHPQVYLAVIDDGDTVWVDREYVWESSETMRQKTDGQYADDLEDFMKGGNRAGAPGRPLPHALVLVPPECASFEAELTLRGIWHTDADNEVADGIRMVSSLMALRKIKFSRERCPKTISKLPAYAWDDKKARRGVEEPVKQKDDECDAVRYMVKTRIPNWRIVGKAA